MKMGVVFLSLSRRRILLMFSQILLLTITLTCFWRELNVINAGRMEGAEVLAIIAEGFDYKEFYDVLYTLVVEGARVTTASFTTEPVTAKYGETCIPEVTFSEVTISLYDIVFIPGGNAPYIIIHHPENQTVLDILTQAYGEGKLIAAICHGPWLLAAADIVSGTRVTCNPDPPMVDDLIAAGAIVDTSKSVIKDGDIITGRDWDSINELAEEIINARTRVELEFKIGWNLVSIPLEPVDPTVDAVFQDNLAHVEAIYGYKSGSWLCWFPVAPSNLTELERSRGYWVLSDSNFKITLMGSIGSSSPLLYGWNLIGVNVIDPVSTEEYLSGSGWTMVFNYDEVTGVWQHYIRGVGGPLATMQPGEGYWVYVESI